MARIKAVLKKETTFQNRLYRKSLFFEGLEIDIAGREVYVDGEKLR